MELLEMKPRVNWKVEEMLSQHSQQHHGERREESREERLEKLGFKKATEQVGRAKKMSTAYAKYQFVSQPKIDKFNVDLRAETLKEDKRAYVFKQLVFTPIEQYDKVPPDHVLDALEVAKAEGCFDLYEVAHIEWKEEIKDPILFGRVNGCSDRFFIAQWDDDVSIEELIK